MSAGKTFGPSNEAAPPTHAAPAKPVRADAPLAFTSRRARNVALLVGLSALASMAGCAAETDDDPELAASEEALRMATDDMQVTAPVAKPRQVATAPQVASGSWTAVQTGGGTVFGGGTVVVNFTRDPDGAWHCTGDADCNKMFLSGVCKGGILDSSCDTTAGVECWCY
jgi:hypothetical protein